MPDRVKPSFVIFDIRALSVRVPGGTPENFVMKFGIRKLESWGYHDGKEIMTLAFFVLTQYRRVTDGQTDTLISQRPALA